MYLSPPNSDLRFPASEQLGYGLTFQLRDERNVIFVSAVDRRGNLALTTFRADFSLDVWFSRGNSIWSKKHRDWGKLHRNSSVLPYTGKRGLQLNFRCLSPEMRAIWKATIQAIIIYHRGGGIHQHLDRPENFLYRRISSDGVSPVFKCIIVSNETSEVSFGDNPRNDKHSDMALFETLIQRYILRGITGELPMELSKLMELINQYHSHDWTSEQEYLLFNHFALWSSEKKSQFWIITVQKIKILDFDSPEFSSLSSSLNKAISPYHDKALWKRLLAGPLKKVLEFPRTYYSGAPIDLWKFIQNAYVHCRERKGQGNYANIDVNSPIESLFIDIDFLVWALDQIFMLSLIPSYDWFFKNSKDTIEMP